MLLVKENSRTTPSYENKTLFLSFWNGPVIFLQKNNCYYTTAIMYMQYLLNIIYKKKLNALDFKLRSLKHCPHDMN